MAVNKVLYISGLKNMSRPGLLFCVIFFKHWLSMCYGLLVRCFCYLLYSQEWLFTGYMSASE